MKPTLAKTLIEEHGVQPSPMHVEAAGNILASIFKTTAEPFAKLPFEAEPGGLYRCEVIPGHTARGEFVELDAPNRLVFTWGWENEERTPPGSSTVEIELARDGDGTTLHFVHTLSSVESAESHSHGWDHYLPRLEIAAAGGDPGEDPWITNAPSM